MNRIDRAMGILLMLRSQKTVSAQALADHYEVSTRTIYRDVDVLTQLGIPIYAEMGRHGGFRLMEGYFMPPVAFNFGEALSIVLGLAFLKGLRVRPFPEDADASERKILAAMPEPMRSQLMRAREIIGLEAVPVDLLHPERDDPQQDATPERQSQEAAALSLFLRAVAERKCVTVDYRSPYAQASRFVVAPAGVIWDRDRWYLVGKRLGDDCGPRTLRADRVAEIELSAERDAYAFDVRSLLGGRWLEKAMAQWAGSAPVRIRMTARLADELGRDWYYRYALFERGGDGSVVMTVGEDSTETVFRLLRWLGPEAELLAPAEWRDAFKAELARMVAVY